MTYSRKEAEAYLKFRLQGMRLQEIDALLILLNEIPGKYPSGSRVSEREASNGEAAQRGDARSIRRILNRKIKEATEALSQLDNNRLQALRTLLDKEADVDFEISEEELAEMDAEFDRFMKGEIKGIPAREALRKIRKKLKTVNRSRSRSGK